MSIDNRHGFQSIFNLLNPLSESELHFTLAAVHHLRSVQDA